MLSRLPIRKRAPAARRLGKTRGQGLLEARRILIPTPLGQIHKRGAPAALCEFGNASANAPAVELDGFFDAR